MRRTSLVLAAAGGAAVLAVTGAALGGQVADRTGPAAVATSRTAGAGPTSTTGDDGPTAAADRDPTAATAAPGAAGVDSRRAGAVALARTGGGRIIEVEAETEHGRAVWSVKVSRDGVTYEVKVDRRDGAVVEVERKRLDDRDGRVAPAGDDRGTDDRYDDHGGRRSGGDDRGTDDRNDDHGGHDRADDHGGDDD
ncbi:PepSY domain-containing protein [Micromonospora sp. NPDC049836]|uniref:PepSY domain-containing protein n=1 Tax=Micromonospora sp. NPDC049836 TaxID=3364274 RepID=UPI003794243F